MVDSKKLISIVIPVYNEESNLPLLYEELAKHMNELPYRFEVLFIDDGSADGSANAVRRLRQVDSRIKLVQLARNFGKEAAVSAGLHRAHGDAVLAMDADLQMPPKLIGEFIRRWEEGAEVVVGVFAKRNMSWFKKIGAHWFYRIMRLIAYSKITPHATDYRLLDRQVVNVFNRLTEHERITRGLIDWLGFKRSYIHFQQDARRHGRAAYSYRKLVALAINSFTSYSFLPLKLAGYLGMCILLISVPLGLFMYVEQYLLDDPLELLITGTDLLGLLLVFLIGVVLSCLGLMALYIARIHAEVVNRPLYVIKETGEDKEGEPA